MSRSIPTIGIATFLLAVTLPFLASANDDLRWSDEFTWRGVAFTPSCVGSFDGSIYIGSYSFSTGGVYVWTGSEWERTGTMDDRIADLTVHNGALWAAGDDEIFRWDGNDWVEVLDRILGGLQPIHAIHSFDGDLVIAGEFTQIQGFLNQRARIVRWDGVDDVQIGTGFNDGIVRALEVHNGELYAGGNMNFAGGQNVSGLARWTGSEWVPVDEGLHLFGGNTGDCYTILSNGSLHVAGRFDQAGFTTVKNAAKFLDGIGWTGIGAGFNATVKELVVAGGALYATGVFTTSGFNTNLAGVARWTGSSWVDLGGGLQRDITHLDPGNGVDLAEHNGTLVVVGAFSAASDVVARNVASWDGAAWMNFGEGEAVNRYIRELAVRDDEIVAIGPIFQAGSLNEEICFARWDGSGWKPYGVTPPVAGAAEGLLDFQGQEIAYGSFDLGSGYSSGLIRRNGTSWENLVAITGFISDATIFQDELVVAGSFSEINGVFANNVARWDGNAWMPLGLGLDNTVDAIHAHGTDLFVSGFFDNAGGQSAIKIARWDGASWHPLSSGLSPGAATSFASYEDDVIVGGAFLQAGGITVNCVARWDGTNWSALGQGASSVVSDVHAIGSDLYIGGFFDEVDGFYSPGIARWDGAAWHALGSGVDGTQGVYTMKEHDGFLYVGGWFETAGGKPSYNFARWDLTPDATDVPQAPANELDHVIQVSPNPFRERTMLSFHQARSEAARVDVFDVAGRHIRTLHEGRLEEGNQQVLWDGRNDKGATVPTGVYFVSLQSESVSAHRKVIRTR
jgi:hypothetical protein